MQQLTLGWTLICLIVIGLAASLTAWAASAPIPALAIGAVTGKAPIDRPGWKLVWSDEFDVPGLPDPKKWTYEEGKVRNGEAQYYTKARPENCRIEGGMLILEARKEPFTGARGSGDYTSASIETKGLGSWQYGRLEMRAKLPQGLGVWPAFWTLGVKGGWAVRCPCDLLPQVMVVADVILHVEAGTRLRDQVAHHGFSKPSWRGEWAGCGEENARKRLVNRPKEFDADRRVRRAPNEADLECPVCLGKPDEGARGTRVDVLKATTVLGPDAAQVGEEHVSGCAVEEARDGRVVNLSELPRVVSGYVVGVTLAHDVLHRLQRSAG